MRNDRHLAIKLRKQNKSYNEISKLLGIPKSTMHYWFKNLRWSKIIKKQLTKKALRLATKQMKAIARANKKRWHEWRKEYRERAKKEFPAMKSNPLFVAGLMLYWGEGTKNPKTPIQLSNIDPKMIRLFKKFLLNICDIDKSQLRLALTLYPDLSKDKCKNFWSKKIGIPLEQIEKPQVIYGRHPTKRLEYGVCSIRVRASSGIKEKITLWTNLLYKEFNP